MIKVVLKGGLGNQMFQYCAGLSLARKLNTSLVLDTTFLKSFSPMPGFTYRKYELDFFNVQNKVVSKFTDELFSKYLGYPLMMLSSFFNNKHYKEKDPYAFDSGFYNLKKGTILEGYFNNTNYFRGVEHEIQKIFDLDKFYNSKFDDIETKIKSCNSVSINIRRGDYTNTKHKDVFVHLDTPYYKEALKIIEKKVENPHYFIFSFDDDGTFEDWIETELGISKNKITLIGKEYVGEQFKTYLRLISLCKHNIISNSTFAFWGAYLNKNQTKTVVCAKRWATKGNNFEAPKSWKIIEN